MPSALSVPICEPTSCNGAWSTRTRVERNAKQTTIATASVIAIFTIIHRKSSRCSRNGFEVSLSGRSRNLKMSRSAIGSIIYSRTISKLARLEREKTARGQPGTNSKSISIANFVLGNHATNLRNTKCAAIQDRFRFVAHIVRRLHDRAGKEKVAALVGKARRREIVTERDEVAVFGQLVASFFAKFTQRDLADCYWRGVAGIIRLRRGYGGQAVPGYDAVDLPGRHFPNGLANRNAFLMNENDFSITRHRRDNDGRFAMHDCPRTRIASRGRLHEIGYNFKMRVGEMALTRNRFPAAFFHATKC